MAVVRLAAAVIILILYGYRGPAPSFSARAATPQASEQNPSRREANDVARFLAGLQGAPGSPFAELEMRPEWQNHQRMLDNAWKRAKVNFIDHLEQFQTHELTSASSRDTVFYPFGGPDILTAVTCFPHSPTYVLVGLEPAGSLPTVGQIQEKDLPGYLAAVRETVASELGRSFFITRQMDHQFRGQVTDGLLVPILHLLVRTNHTILGFRQVRVDEEGKVVAWPGPNFKAPFWNKGVEVDFRNDTDESTHRLYYFGVNLSDKKLEQNQGFRTYLASLKSTATLLKATSYMTHRPEFSLIREVMLTESAMILQDDSGIPFHYFHPDVWQRQLYGQYTRPYGSFKWLEQPDLREAYMAPPGPRPLPLRIGYGYSQIPSNLLLAKKIAAMTTASVQKH